MTVSVHRLTAPEITHVGQSSALHLIRADMRRCGHLHSHCANPPCFGHAPVALRRQISSQTAKIRHRSATSSINIPRLCPPSSYFSISFSVCRRRRPRSFPRSFRCFDISPLDALSAYVAYTVICRRDDVSLRTLTTRVNANVQSWVFVCL